MMNPKPRSGSNREILPCRRTVCRADAAAADERNALSLRPATAMHDVELHGVAFPQRHVAKNGRGVNAHIRSAVGRRQEPEPALMVEPGHGAC